MTDLLSMKEVSVNFGGVAALTDVSFGVAKGDVVGLIGPNGAGKTTMLNAISGLAGLRQGSISFSGETINGLRPHKITRRGVARTFQIVRPFAHLSVLDNAIVGATFSSAPHPSRAETVERASEALGLVGLEAKMEFLPHELTLSERKRLEVARALAMRPKMLLLDEVMAGLNHSEIDPIVALVRKVNEAGVTIILVEHVMKAVMAACHRIVVLQFGKKIAEGTPQQIAADEHVIQAYLGSRFAARQARQNAGRAQ